MSAQSITNLQEQTPPPSLDARFLREEARQLIERLAGDRWTDYNSHDPGITILEALAYAVTDLGLRTELDIRDLIAADTQTSFFTAERALSNAPYSTADYLRLLHDHPAVRHAWIDWHAMNSSGLYNLLVALEPFPGDETHDPGEVWLRGQTGGGYDFYVVFSYWEELPEIWKTASALQNVSINTGDVFPLDDPLKPTFEEYYTEPVFTFATDNGEQTLENMGVRIRLPRGVERSMDEDFRGELAAALPIDFFRPFLRRVQQREGALTGIRRHMLQNRNLCEDWPSIHTSRIQQIGLRIEELELQPEADPAEVIAGIYFAIEHFIFPFFKPQCLNDLLDRGLTPSDIFDGPVLAGGFFPEEAISPRPLENIYVSDLVRIIMRQPGVIGVNGLTLDLYFDRLKIAAGVRNCLRLRDPQLYKPKFSFEDSEIGVTKRGAPVNTDRSLIAARLEILNTDQRQNRPECGDQDLPVPAGEIRPDLTTFYSIQNEFPEVYGLREGEIAGSAPPLRHAQVKQLKGYLLFFEQLLVNYAAQLGNVSQLFSIDSLTDRTYFFQTLYDVPAVRDLFKAFVDLKSDDPLLWEEEWRAFRQSCNAHVKELDLLTEDRTTFVQRRNRFADHLLARFGEDFSAYAAWAFVKNGGAVPSDLLLDKLAFLQKLPELGARRATAFDYAGDEVWDTENISGFEKRVAALLGIPDCRRRSLAQTFDLNDYIEEFDRRTRNGREEARIRIRDAANARELLASVRHYPAGPELEAAKAETVALAAAGKYYAWATTQPTANPTCLYSLLLLDRNMDAAAPFARRNGVFNNRAKMEIAVREIIHLLQGRALEGMHLVEHILLIPRTADSEELEPVRFENAGDLSFIPDPYPFQLSIFLPGWTPRFRDAEFRVVVEQTLRRELPAHLFAWIYWVELEDGAIPQVFIDFETTFRNWLENRSEENTLNAFVIAFNALVKSEFATRTNRYRPFTL